MIKWTYKQHNFLHLLVSPIIRVFKFVDKYSWEHAHYKNGNGSKLNIKPSIRNSWIDSRDYD